MGQYYVLEGEVTAREVRTEYLVVLQGRRSDQTTIWLKKKKKEKSTTFTRVKTCSGVGERGIEKRKDQNALVAIRRKMDI